MTLQMVEGGTESKEMGEIIHGLVQRHALNVLLMRETILHTSRTIWLITELADLMNCRVRGFTYSRTIRMV